MIQLVKNLPIPVINLQTKFLEGCKNGTYFCMNYNLSTPIH